eukprot:SAG11_NODE_37271_length_257_cov_1.949367_1_plen_33_part_01
MHMADYSFVANNSGHQRRIMWHVGIKDMIRPDA